MRNGNIQQLSDIELSYKHSTFTLRFLMTDYVDHLAHHLEQLANK